MQETSKFNCFVLNLRTGKKYEGEATNAKEAYSKITINKGDTTTLKLGKRFFVKEW